MRYSPPGPQTFVELWRTRDTSPVLSYLGATTNTTAAGSGSSSSGGGLTWLDGSTLDYQGAWNSTAANTTAAGCLVLVRGGGSGPALWEVIPWTGENRAIVPLPQPLRELHSGVFSRALRCHAECATMRRNFTCVAPAKPCELTTSYKYTADAGFLTWR
mgnify:CR=1 FL=1